MWCLVLERKRKKKKESLTCSWSSCIFSTLKGWCNTISLGPNSWENKVRLYFINLKCLQMLLSSATPPSPPRHNSNQVDSQSCSKVVCSFFFKFGCSFFFSEAPILPDFDIIPTELGRHCLLNSAHCNKYQLSLGQQWRMKNRRRII